MTIQLLPDQLVDIFKEKERKLLTTAIIFYQCVRAVLAHHSFTFNILKSDYLNTVTFQRK